MKKKVLKRFKDAECFEVKGQYVIIDNGFILGEGNTSKEAWNDAYLTYCR